MRDLRISTLSVTAVIPVSLQLVGAILPPRYPNLPTCDRNQGLLL